MLILKIVVKIYYLKGKEKMERKPKRIKKHKIEYRIRGKYRKNENSEEDICIKEGN